MADTLATQLQMNKQLKLINDFYYYRPGKGALSSNTCFYIICISLITKMLSTVPYGNQKRGLVIDKDELEGEINN